MACLQRMVYFSFTKHRAGTMTQPHGEPHPSYLVTPPIPAHNSHLLIQDGDPSSSQSVYIFAGREVERGEKSQTFPLRMLS